jgi:hypothetical protein
VHAGCGKAQSQASDAGWDGLLFSDDLSDESLTNVTANTIVGDVE